MNRILRLLLGGLLSLSALGVQAQYGAAYKPKGHEIGLEPVALRLVPAYTSGYTDGLPVSVDLLRGLRYKFHLNQHDGLRLGIFRQRQAYQPSSLAEVTRQETQLQLGYQRSLTMRQHVLFAGIDGLFAQGTVSQPAQDNAPAINSGYRSGGANFFAGYRLHLSPYLSATFELGGYYLRTSYDVFRPTLGAENPYLYPTQEFGLTTSLYLSFHFGELPDWGCTCWHPK